MTIFEKELSIVNILFKDIQLRLLQILLNKIGIIKFAKLVLVTLFILMTGYLFTRLLMRRGLQLTFFEVMGTSYLLGFGIVPFITLILSVLSIELRWLSLFMPILIVDIVLFSLTFPENMSLNAIRTVLHKFGRTAWNKKDIVFFFFVVYTIAFSLMLLPLVHGVYLGIMHDSWRYAVAAEHILNGKSPFSNEVIYYGEECPPITHGCLSNQIYTIFYLLTLVSLTVLSGIADVYTVSYLFAPTFSISGLPLTTYILLDRFKAFKPINQSIVKLGVFLVLFVSEEILFFSVWGKGNIVAISYLFLSLNFFFRSLQQRNKNEFTPQKIEKIQFEAILSGFFAGIASLYHITAFIFVVIIAFFLVVEFLVSRREIKKILVPVGIFFIVSISVALFEIIYWGSPNVLIPIARCAQTGFVQTGPSRTGGHATGSGYLFLRAPIIQGFLYPFLYHYVPLHHHRTRTRIEIELALFFFGTATLFVLALLSVFFDKSWTKNIEKRLLLCGFVFMYFFPLLPIITFGKFYFYSNRFIIFLEIFSSMLFLSSLNKEFINHNLIRPVFWVIIIFLTFRWYAYALLLLI